MFVLIFGLCELFLICRLSGVFICMHVQSMISFDKVHVQSKTLMSSMCGYGEMSILKT